MDDNVLNKKNEDAEKLECFLRKMDAVTLLAGNMSHDFNNHLTVINGYADLLLDMIPETQEAHEMVAEILQAVGRSRLLTEELLDFSRNKPFKTETVNLNAVLGKLKDQIVQTLPPAIDFQLVCNAEAAEVLLDPGRLEKAAKSLVANAAAAMPDGGTLTITTSTADKLPPNLIPQYDEALTADSYAVLSVSDTGVGMDSETADRIFEPFFTTRKNGQGSGLGLSDVYGFVKQSRGKIQLQTAPGAGTTFKIYLPCSTNTA
ncbi:MAG: hypothetical protein KAR11_00090 [Phycisphaerae bacterium]|nr:hypothetical protein [Phycisphaerae bacterium]